ncbi:hypothetical protein DdX_12684 [Ditylenchus destructor]|uniref:Uncharacterized protein n=1 Tax=Ditylenchus destructor TaxID=166010 RepID=A0AAD4R3J3_9BILA|nr:hypothetical protein DdX_12684 [Ditylenchus destructor]
MVTPKTGMIAASVQIAIFLASVAAKDVPVMVTILFHSTRTFKWDKDEDMTIGELKTWMLDQKQDSDTPLIKCDFSFGAYGNGEYFPETTKIREIPETIPSLTNSKHHVIQMYPKGETIDIPTSYLTNSEHKNMTILGFKRKIHAQKRKENATGTVSSLNIYFTPGAHDSKGEYFSDQTEMKDLPKKGKIQIFTKAVSESE